MESFVEGGGRESGLGCMFCMFRGGGSQMRLWQLEDASSYHTLFEVLVAAIPEEAKTERTNLTMGSHTTTSKALTFIWISSTLVTWLQ